MKRVKMKNKYRTSKRQKKWRDRIAKSCPRALVACRFLRVRVRFRTSFQPSEHTSPCWNLRKRP
jgi:hypothetical protein